jgi:beta-aspartyl-peptidase (threonine type)
LASIFESKKYMKPKIIVHGGAHSSDEEEPQRQQDVDNACQIAHEVLVKKGAVDAVETAISLMETSKVLNAGRGSYLQLDGIARMDAAIMKDDLAAGGVIGIEDVEHPISVARRVMETTQHVILSGRLATEFAHSEGFPRFDPRTRSRVNVWMDIVDEFRTKTSYEQIFHVDQYLGMRKSQFGTVGCVAIDSMGNISAGTSTGGLKMNVPGRVGDSAIMGAGTYCSRDGGVSCTGCGEKILVLSLAKEVVNYLRYEKHAKATHAAEHGIEELSSVDADGGLICIDRHGNVGYAYNTEVMTMCYVD